MQPREQIRVLSTHVANKIAAGEVVERPASVLKELLENAVDSGATRIDAEITAGGRKLVAVRDNGSGMARDDALLSIERQATSKIRDVDDIERIATLGFRGEALAAVASVSRLRIETCLAGEMAGTELLVTAGKISDVQDSGCPAGTSVEVRDLFFNVPARRKFLRTFQTEQFHVRAGFVSQALSHPAVGMSLKIDGREVFRLAADSSLQDRLRDLFGSDLYAGLRPVTRSADGMEVSGYVSRPGMDRADRNEIHVFVNGRATSAPVINYAIREGYHTLLPSGRHPSVFLYLAIDPAQVDVNVHPTKREVRFRHSGRVRDAVIAAIRDALAAASEAREQQGDSRPAGSPPMPAAAEAQLRIDDLPAPRAFRYPRMPAMGAPAPGAAGGQQDAAGPQTAVSDAVSPWSWCRVLGQIGGLYVVLEIEDGYVMLDPHAAHERVLFERFLRQVREGSVQTQNLLMPETVELGAADALRVRRHMDLFLAMGFGLSDFGGDSFVVDALPSCFGQTPARSLLQEIAHASDTAGERGAKTRLREESVARAACRTAVKARDRLRLDEIEQLVIDLARTEMPYTCPHGRPTMIFTYFKELNRKFGRA